MPPVERSVEADNDEAVRRAEGVRQYVARRTRSARVRVHYVRVLARQAAGDEVDRKTPGTEGKGYDRRRPPTRRTAAVTPLPAERARRCIHRVRPPPTICIIHHASKVRSPHVIEHDTRVCIRHIGFAHLRRQGPAERPVHSKEAVCST